MDLEGMVSIIIPAYNAEKTIEKCLRSVLEQTYSHFELIVVNDGSQDDSLAICKRFESEDDRITVVDKPNEGVSAARNKGIDMAKGEYIMFIDADDWIDRDYLETMTSAIGEADISISSFVQEYGAGAVERPYKKALNRDLSGEEIMGAFAKDCIDCKIYTYLVWGKLYRRTSIGEVRFVRQAYSEDAVFIREVISRCNKISFIQNEGYHYSISGKGVTDDTSRRLERSFGALNMLYLFGSKYLPYTTNEYRIRYYDTLKGELEATLKSSIKTNSKMENMDFVVQQCGRMLANDLTAKDRIKLAAFFALWKIVCR